MKKKVLLLVTILMLIITSIAYAKTFYCNICNAPMMWNGETVVEWGQMFNVLECMNGHRALVRPDEMY